MVQSNKPHPKRSPKRLMRCNFLGKRQVHLSTKLEGINDGRPQEAVAVTLRREFALLKQGNPDCLFFEKKRATQRRRDFLVGTLKRLGFKVTVPQSGMFLLMDINELGLKFGVWGSGKHFDTEGNLNIFILLTQRTFNNIHNCITNFSVFFRCLVHFWL